MNSTHGRGPLRKTGQDTDLEALEHLLQTSLYRVEPRPAFRNGLHTRLARTPVPARSPATIMQYVIISLGGVAAAALLLIAGAQAIAALLNSLGLLQQMSSSKDNVG